MAFRENQVVVVGVLGLVPVVLQVAGDQDRDEVGGGHRGGRVSGAGGRAAANGIDPQLLPKLTRELEIGGGQRLGGDRHLTPNHSRVATLPPSVGRRDPSVYGLSLSVSKNHLAPLGRRLQDRLDQASRSTSLTLPSRILRPASQKPGSVMSMPSFLTSSSGRV